MKQKCKFCGKEVTAKMFVENYIFHCSDCSLVYGLTRTGAVVLDEIHFKQTTSAKNKENVIPIYGAGDSDDNRILNINEIKIGIPVEEFYNKVCLPIKIVK